MTRSGQRISGHGPADLAGLLEHLVVSLPGRVTSGTGLPEWFRWWLPDDHPALRTSSLKQLQRATRDDPPADLARKRLKAWMAHRFGVDRTVLETLLPRLADVGGDQPPILTFVQWMRDTMARVDDVHPSWPALLACVEARLRAETTSASVDAAALERRIENAVFVAWSVARAVEPFLTRSRASVDHERLLRVRWIPRLVREGRALEPSRRVYVDELLRARARHLGAARPGRRTDQIAAVAKAVDPEERNDGTHGRIGRAIGRLLGPARIDAITARRVPDHASQHALTECLGLAEHPRSAGLMLRGIVLLDRVQRSLLIDGYAPGDIVAGFDRWANLLADFDRSLLACRRERHA